MPENGGAGKVGLFDGQLQGVSSRRDPPRIANVELPDICPQMSQMRRLEDSGEVNSIYNAAMLLSVFICAICGLNVFTISQMVCLADSTYPAVEWRAAGLTEATYSSTDV
jgi:hypothetical protein